MPIRADIAAIKKEGVDPVEVTLAKLTEWDTEVAEGRSSLTERLQACRDQNAELRQHLKNAATSLRGRPKGSGSNRRALARANRTIARQDQRIAELEEQVRRLQEKLRSGVDQDQN